ncbi:glycosyltransferase family 2 protein [Paenibacillus spongiae]|uniref:Glycosyltransferase n=1 Tax=Paenibacillus spongiae TaxID=2909671 RepID=A0ABY5SC31_9BACL|nr:glycosyltransferase [Paenibacillus spongiae]UVI31522.1 glycosyltransferase [Paenibacillus spongiae]
MKPRISIIVPIFNMESYLHRCLTSLTSQSMDDIQIIAVNDGSTDSSLQIVRQFAENDDRIIVIHQENGGVSSARNAGIRAAEGEFIGFVDPDDWIDTTMYEDMYKEAIRHEVDIVMCSYIREFGSHAIEKKYPVADLVCYRGEEVRNEMVRRLVGPINDEVANPELLDAWGTVWSKIFRAEIIKNNEITFVDLHLIGSNEDSLFNIHAFYYATSFVFMNKPYYHYWKANTGSITSRHNPNLMNQFLVLYTLIESFLKEKMMPSSFQLALSNRISLNTLGLGLNTITKKSSMYRKVSDIQTVLNHPRIRGSLSQFETSSCPMVWKAFFLCAKNRFSLGLYMLLLAVDRLRKMKR